MNPWERTMGWMITRYQTHRGGLSASLHQFDEALEWTKTTAICCAAQWQHRTGSSIALKVVHRRPFQRWFLRVDLTFKVHTFQPLETPSWWFWWVSAGPCTCLFTKYSIAIKSVSQLHLLHFVYYLMYCDFSLDGPLFIIGKNVKNGWVQLRNKRYSRFLTMGSLTWEQPDNKRSASSIFSRPTHFTAI